MQDESRVLRFASGPWRFHPYIPIGHCLCLQGQQHVYTRLVLPPRARRGRSLSVPMSLRAFIAAISCFLGIAAVGASVLGVEPRALTVADIPACGVSDLQHRNSDRRSTNARIDSMSSPRCPEQWLRICRRAMSMPQCRAGVQHL